MDPRCGRSLSRRTKRFQNGEAGRAGQGGQGAARAPHRRRSSPIRIDGRIDDEAWMGAEIISDFQQEEPDNLMAPTEQTRVRVACDDRYL